MMTTERRFEHIDVCDIPGFVKSDFTMPKDQ